MMWVSSILPDCLTRVSDQDSKQQKTWHFTKISQQENSTVQTNIKVVSWVTKYKQYKKTSQIYVLPKIKLISHTSPDIFSIAKQP